MIGYPEFYDNLKALCGRGEQCESIDYISRGYKMLVDLLESDEDFRKSVCEVEEIIHEDIPTPYHNYVFIYQIQNSGLWEAVVKAVPDSETNYVTKRMCVYYQLINTLIVASPYYSVLMYECDKIARKLIYDINYDFVVGASEYIRCYIEMKEYKFYDIYEMVNICTNRVLNCLLYDDTQCVDVLNNIDNIIEDTIVLQMKYINKAEETVMCHNSGGKLKQLSSAIKLD